MMEEVDILDNIQKVIVDNDVTERRGHIPGLGRQDFKHREFKIVKLFERKIENWFQNGHPMKSWITDSEWWYNRRESFVRSFPHG